MSELPQADRFCDQRDDNPYCNESVWFSFSIPERKIHGLIQYYSMRDTSYGSLVEISC